MADRQGSGEQAKHQERLCTGLILDIVCNWVWDEVLGLEEHLQHSDIAQRARIRAKMHAVARCATSLWVDGRRTAALERKPTHQDELVHGEQNAR